MQIVIIVVDTVISIHALLAESDHNTKNNCIDYCDFYPRSPCGERPEVLIVTVALDGFLSTLSLRRATLSIPVPA